jgi:hypothetical protein
MVCVRYRARQPHASPVWQILYGHAADVPGLSSEAAGAIDAFLDCGDLHAGFIRFRCPDCGYEFIGAFYCKGFSRRAKTYQTGFELPAAPQVAPTDSGQGELFGDDYAQPDDADREPVFWPDGAGRSTPDDAYVHADAPDCAC